MNIVVYCVIQCWNDIYVCSFILWLSKAFWDAHQSAFSYSHVNLTKVELIFSYDSSKLSKFLNTLQTRKLLIVTSISGQKKNGESS